MRTHIIESKFHKDRDKYKSLGFKLIFEIGWGNGYVILDKGHPWEGLEYDDIPVDIHGGLTFSKYIKNEDDLEWMGEGASKDDIGKYMIGFDTGHYGDNPIIWTKEAVQKEANRLLEQAEKAWDNYNNK